MEGERESKVFDFVLIGLWPDWVGTQVAGMWRALALSGWHLGLQLPCSVWICVFGRYLSVLIGQVAENVTDLGWFGIVSIYKISVNPDVSHTLDPHHILYCLCVGLITVWISVGKTLLRSVTSAKPPEWFDPWIHSTFNQFPWEYFQCDFLVVWTLLVEDFKTI